jgi:hypothetical protein
MLQTVNADGGDLVAQDATDNATVKADGGDLVAQDIQAAAVSIKNWIQEPLQLQAGMTLLYCTLPDCRLQTSEIGLATNHWFITPL